jgi:hypothetical protein
MLSYNAYQIFGVNHSNFIIFSAAGFGFDCSNLQKTVDGYNEKVDQSPLLLRALLGEEIVDITMLLNNGTIAKWGLETENARIVRFQNEGIEAPTIVIYATKMQSMMSLERKTPWLLTKRQKKPVK